MDNNNLGNIYSDKFKRWFGDWENDPQNASKVVDGNGLPLPVYHGTTSKTKEGTPFKVFKCESMFGQGAMFADNRSVASFFSGGGNARFRDFETEFENYPHKDTIEGLVSFLNNILSDGRYEIYHAEGEYDGEPYEIFRLDHTYEGGSETSAFLGYNKKDAHKKLYQEVEKEVYKTQYQPYNGGIYKVYLNIRNPYVFDAKGNQFFKLNTEFDKKNKMNVFTLVSYVRQMNQYDGVIVHNVRETTYGEGELTTDYIVFRPNQVKHATDNNGEYSESDDMTEEKLHDIIKEAITEALITEGAETRNMKAAKHYLYQNKGMDEEQAMKTIGAIKTDIPNSRLGKCKFMLAMVRMFCNGELNDGITIMNVNKSLKYAASEAHINEYDNNLNNMTAQQLTDKFSGAGRQDLEQDRNDVSSQQYDNTQSQYQIVRIDSFDEASEYGNYTNWCVTHYENMYNSYTSNGMGVFYFCLRDGWEDEPEVQGEGCPLDSYGLSMIAVSVNPDGSCNTVTCRWNHANGGNDNIMTTKQLSETIGRNFYETFKPLTKEEIETRQRMLLGEIEDEIWNEMMYKPLYDIAQSTLEYDPDYGDKIQRNVYVYVSNEKSCYVIVDEEGKVIIDKTFEYVGYRVSDCIIVTMNNKENIIKLYLQGDMVKGKILFDTWFKKITPVAMSKYFLVYLAEKKKWNLVDQNGNYILKEWHDSIDPYMVLNGFISLIDNGKETLIDIKTQQPVFDKSINSISRTKNSNLFIRLEGEENMHIYDLYTLELKAPWEIKRLLGYTSDDYDLYGVELSDGNRYEIDKNGDLYEYDTPDHKLVKENPMKGETLRKWWEKKKNEYQQPNESVMKPRTIIITEKQMNEVRYIDTRDEKYNGKVRKKHWTDIYNQEEITDDSRIRVFHGCELKTACDIAINGTSGRTYHPRQYSYESGMNPLGIFVTTDFETAKKFGVSNSGMCIIEFTAKGSDLESPVWNGQGSYFGQGSNPMPFDNAEQRNAQKMQYRQDALNTKDDYYYDGNKRRDISMSHVRNSDKPEMADRIFNNSEHQALFMGDLNPNMIKRIWVNLPREDGYVHTTDSYQPMSVRQFLKQFKDKEWQDGYDYKGQPIYTKIRKQKLFNPNDDVKSFDDLVDAVMNQDRKFFKSREQVIKTLNDIGLTDKEPSKWAIDSISHMLWPKQIIQLYGQGFFNKYFNRLGQ